MNTDKIECVLLDDPINTRRHPVPGPNGVKWTTEAPTGESNSYQITSKHCKTSLREHHRIAAWNVRGLLKPGKLSIVEKEMACNNLRILAISETHMRGNGHFKTPSGNTLYFSGSEVSSLAGVGILVPAKLNGHVLGYNPVSDRIITMKLNTIPCRLNLISIYAPTSQSSEEELDQFYGTLEDTLDSIPNREITMVLGDWNAKVGKTVADDHLREILGNHGLGNRNERGERLIGFCTSKKLVILNTCFQHHPRRLYTWKSPGDRYRNQIDYILIDSRWRSSVHNVKTFPGADCGTDHNLLVASFALRLKSPRKRIVGPPRLLNALDTKTFQQTMETKLMSTSFDSANANSLWTQLKTLVSDTLSDLYKNKQYEPKKSLWISDRTWALTQRRKDLKVKGLQDPEVRKDYVQLCKTIDACCSQDKNQYIQGICIDIEEHSLKHHTADLFKKVRLLTRKFKPKTWAINDANGILLHQLDEVTERWRCYCEELYKCEAPSIMPTTLPGWEHLELEPDILRSEVYAALNALKSKKAPGPDSITAEILRALGDTGIDILHTICRAVWVSGEWPQDWTESIILPLHKKGSTKQCDNYRTLALISHASKILLQIINKRIRHYLDWQIPQEQAGFVKGKGAREQILNVRQVIEKAYEYNTPVIMCFVDYSKAFDCVNWDSLWRVLAELGVPNHLTALLQTLYCNSQGVVRIDETLSQPFKFKKGVRQGCILSPVLFNAYGEYIMRQTCDQWEGGIRIGGIKITNLRYADDTTLLAADEAEMCILLERMEKISNDLGLSINKSKTKIMVIDRTKQMELTGALNLEVVEDFVYLGSTVTNNGSCEPDVRRRIGMAKNAMSQLHRTWRDRKISLKTKIKLVRTLVFSIFCYGAETWTLRSSDRKKIDSFEMWCWRKMLRIPWTAFRTNASILAQLRVTTRLSTICLKRILEYFGHIARKDGDNLEKLVLTGKVDGKRSRGRSPMRWSDQIRTTLDSTVYDALNVAGDRSKWRNIIKRVVMEGVSHDPQI